MVRVLPAKRATLPTCVLLLLAASCHRPEPRPNVLPPDAVMLPSSTDAIRGVFERLKPALAYEKVSIDHDHVLATVCTATAEHTCFDVRLDPPRAGCTGTIAGAFCVTFPAPPPAGAREAIEGSSRQADWTAIWSAAERKDTTTWQDRARELAGRASAWAFTQEHIGLAVLFALGLLFAWAHTRGGPRARTSIEFAIAAALVVVAYFWLRRLNISNEGNEVFLTEIECETVGECYTVGPGSSVLFYNGAVWPEILLAIRLFGGTPAHAHALALMLMSVGVGVLFVVVSRFARPVAAVPAAVLAIALLGARPIVSPVLDNSMTALSCFGVALGLYVYVLTERPAALLVAAMFESHAFNTHVSAISLLPAVLFIPAIAGKPWSRALQVAGLGFLGASFMTSAAELAGNVVMLLHAGLLVLALFGAFCLVAIGVKLNPRYQRLSQTKRLLVLLLSLTLPHSAGMIALVIIKHPVLPGYLPPLVAPFAIAGGLLLVALLDRLPLRSLRVVGPLVASLYALSLNHEPPVGSPSIVKPADS